MIPLDIDSTWCEQKNAYINTIEDFGLKNLSPDILFELIKIQASRISKLELNFQA